MKLCPSCGKQNIDRAKFCGYCGSALNEPESPSTPQEWRTDETIKASPIFLQELEKKNRPAPPPVPVRRLPRISLRLLIVFLALTGLLSAGWLLLKPPLNGPSAPSFEIKRINPFQGTETPTPSVTPTLTPSPTATVTNTPTPSPSPTATLPPVGIGVRRQDVITIFTNLGYAFQEVDPVLSQPRWIGRSIDKTCSLELVGDAKEITRATLIVGPSEVGDQEMVGGSYQTRFLTILVPDWYESGTWLQAGLRKISNATENAPQVNTTAGNKIIVLSARKNLGLTILTVQGAPAVP